VPAGAAELAIRPQALLLRVGDPGPTELRGRIARAAYLGSHMEYQVVADGLDKELFVIDPAVATPMRHGTTVAITLSDVGVSVVVPG
jgi:iron(III) transport system ATP-binding protein